MMNLQNSPKIGLRKKLPEIPTMTRLGEQMNVLLNSFKLTIEMVSSSISKTREASDRVKTELLKTNQRLENKLLEQTQVENELRQANQDLRQALEKEKNLTDLKTRLLSMASHEFRTPLTIVMMATDMLETFGNSLTIKQRINFLSRIKISTELMTELMNEILQYNRIDSGLETLTSKEIDLTRFCSELVDETRLISDHEHNLIFLVHQETDGAVFTVDPLVLRQIINNLLSNAVKYSPKGGRVKFILTLCDEHVTFRVADQGLGIPEDELHSLFEAFQRGSNVRNIQGTGLGLAIVKKYVEMYEGKIEVQSKVNEGSTFTVTLPLAQCPSKKLSLSNSR